MLACGQSDAKDMLYRKIAWRLVPFLTICYVVALIDRANIGFAKLQFQSDLGIGEAAFGLSAGLFFLGYSVFEIPSNMLLARTSARLTISRIMILWSLVTASLSLVSEVEHFYILRFLLGAAEAGFFPGVLLYLSRWLPATRLASAIAVFMSALGISGVVGGPLSGFIMSSLDGVHGWPGWRWLFAIEGVPGIVLGVLVLKLLPDAPSTASWLSADERRDVIADLAAQEVVDEHRDSKAVADILRDPGFYALGLMAMALLTGLGGVSLWLPTILRHAGETDLALIGLLAAIPYLVALVAQQAAGRSSDRKGERRWHVAVAMMIAGCGWFALPWVADSTALSLAALTLACAGAFAATGPFWSMPPAYFREKAAPVGIATVTTVGAIAAFVSPIIVGWLASRTGSLAAGQLYIGALSVCAAAGLLMVRTDPPEPRPHPAD